MTKPWASQGEKAIEARKRGALVTAKVEPKLAVPLPSPGEAVVYFEGPHLQDNCPLCLRDAMQEAAKAGLVSLVQRRLGDGHFAYMAIGRRWPT